MTKVCWVAAGMALLSFAQGPAGTAVQTPAERKISQAKEAQQKYQKWAPAAAALAAAMVERAHETGDSQYLREAEVAIAESLRLEPDNVAALKARVQLMLEQDSYRSVREALPLAEALRKRGPDDLEVSSLVARTALKLGRYQTAEEAAQFIRDLRPAERMGFERGAEIREVYGDIAGSLAYYRESLPRIPTDEQYQRADVLIRMAQIMAISGNGEGATQTLRQAQASAPGYYRVTLALGRLQFEEGNVAMAVETLHDGGLSLEWQFWRALALMKSGRNSDLTGLAARLEKSNSRLLGRYYLMLDRQPKTALRVMLQAAKLSEDVETLHLLAWAQWADGEPAKAHETIQKALRIGVREPEMLLHAGQIAAAAGDQPTADRLFRELTALNPRSPFVAELRGKSGPQWRVD